ncbi:hypothetical protein NS365_16645 [Aureimonas ureilytica]|uniref:Uncharacterized protein n=1 Tax=Aureimonas ureilytica TaxID=401562 RepID=A0A175RKU5_9HYPH|nr:hypothetical protein [Aureimonas ureilytica]KTR04031.1 hypothetical protein NS365_16645 [Aureimonas ureilytica]
MVKTKNPVERNALVAEWPFPVSAAMGSAVRAKGIERELTAKLPWILRDRLSVQDGAVRLAFDADEAEAFERAREAVQTVLDGIDTLPVLPREVDDILTILPRERLRWTKDGRLPSAGTRTVKLRGRAKAVTFHVFDPRRIEDVLDRDLPSLWREEDREAAAEARRRAAAKVALKRSAKGAEKSSPSSQATPKSTASRPTLEGWEVFQAEGLLR